MTWRAHDEAAPERWRDTYDRDISTDRDDVGERDPGAICLDCGWSGPRQADKQCPRCKEREERKAKWKR